MSLSNLKIGTRLMGLLGLMLILMATINFLAQRNLTAANVRLAQTYQDKLQPIRLVEQAAAESMEEQAGNLTTAVGLFKLAQSGRVLAAKPAAKPAGALSAPARKPAASVTAHPSAKAKPAKSAGGDWTEF